MHFNLYKNINEAYIHPTVVTECDFAAVVEILKDSQQLVDYKEQPMMFNLCSWRDDFESPEYKPGFIRRCKRNVSQIYALLLDIDGTRTLEDAVTEFIDYEFLIYSTFGNNREREKFRLVLPLQTPLTCGEFDQRHDSMCDHFRVDRASFTISQAFYLPCYTQANHDIAFIEHNKTASRFEALLMPARIINDNITEHVMPAEPDAISRSIYKTLLTGSNMRYADALPVAVVIKSRGFTLQDYKNLIAVIAGADSSLRNGLADIDTLWQQAYTTNVTHEKLITLMTRLNCDMWRWHTNDNTH